MDLFLSLLLVLHLVALVVAGATNVAMPLVGRAMGVAPPETRQRLAPIARRLSQNARGALAVLVLTGIAMVQLRYGGDVLGLGPWFLAKLACVVAILVALVAGLVLKPGAIDPRIFAWTTRLALLGIIVCSVMTFG